MVAMLVDDAMDHTVEPANRPLVQEIPGNRDRVRYAKGPAKSRGDLLRRIVERAADGFHLVRDVGVEEHFRDDQQRETHELVMHVERVAISPLVEGVLGIAHHHVAIGRNAIPVERRLRETPLTKPEVALTGEEPVAEDAPDVSPEERMLDEVLVIGHQDLLDVLRIAEHERRPSREAQEGDLSVIARA